MRKSLIFTALTFFLIGCSQDHNYKNLLTKLDTKTSIDKELIKEVRGYVTNNSKLTADQATELETHLTDYMLACAEDESAKINNWTSQIMQIEDQDVAQGAQDSLDMYSEYLKTFGLFVYSAEGEIYTDIMPMFIAEIFWEYYTPLQQELAFVKERELENPTLEDAGVIIPYSEICDRLAFVDDVATKYAKDSTVYEADNYRFFYLQLLIDGIDNSLAFDWNSNKLHPEIKDALYSFVLEHPNSKSTPVITEFLDILKKTNYVRSPESNEFTKKFYNFKQAE